MQVGRGTVSLADAYAHSYQESKVPLVTPAGKHAGEVELFFVFASKEVALYNSHGWHEGNVEHTLAIFGWYFACRINTVLSSILPVFDLCFVHFMKTYFVFPNHRVCCSLCNQKWPKKHRLWFPCLFLLA